MSTRVAVDAALRERIDIAIHRYLLNPPFKGLFGTADDLTEIVLKELEEWLDANAQLHHFGLGDEDGEPGSGHSGPSRGH